MKNVLIVFVLAVTLANQVSVGEKDRNRDFGRPKHRRGSRSESHRKTQRGTQWADLISATLPDYKTMERSFTIENTRNNIEYTKSYSESMRNSTDGEVGTGSTGMETFDYETTTGTPEFVEEEVVMSFVIATGFSHSRELGVIIRGINQDQIDEAVLEVYEGFSDPSDNLRRLDVRKWIYNRKGDSIYIFTGIHVKETSWSKHNYPPSDWYRGILIVDEVVIGEATLPTDKEWMATYMDRLAYMPIIYMAVPGTLTSGAFRRYKHYETNVARVTYTQEEDILTQLIYGIRSFEFQPVAVARMDSAYSGYDYFIYNGHNPTGRRLQPMLEDIHSYLVNHKHEVVFINFDTDFKEDEELYGLAGLIEETIGKSVN
ncbi:hypothetical protein BIW11_08603 [Tropilaelaps mercedesae]|uniref:Uncharacterized protein n=1 Tax=Tropilaelaps mercedesae TaxID=418985 RepID=A0A1V9XNX4_9ACAR|nr:hypothetical protein BIW11_08603 [Tropilaelaps mercedesae]